MKRILIICIFLFSFTGCSPAENCGGNNGPVLRILFVGNSYTMVNDLPGMFAQTACAGGHQVLTDMAAQGGWTLAQHLASPDTLNKIGSQKWDYIVLQEQSEIPSEEAYRLQTMYPAARGLVAKIRTDGAKPIFFMTWAHRTGTPYGPNNFNAMQEQLYTGYMGIAKELGVQVAPVGYAWTMGMLRPNPLQLWQDDGSHPNPQGTYLAACIFYASIFHQSPVGIKFTAGLAQDNAQDLQTLAKDSVINQSGRWEPPFQ